MDDLTARLSRLHETVCRTKSKRAAIKSAAWHDVKTLYPEHAAMIAEFSRVFGKPKRVMVLSDGIAILDSRLIG